LEWNKKIFSLDVIATTPRAHFFAKIIDLAVVTVRAEGGGSDFRIIHTQIQRISSQSARLE
jgi:hypothetical protein